MSEKSSGGVLNTLATVGGLAAMVGAAVLAGAVGLSWQPQHTSQLVIALASICGGGFVVLALTVGLFVGIAFYRRLTDDGQSGRWQAGPPALPANYYRELHPPALANPDMGEWRSAGPQSYDLWEDEPLTPAVKGRTR